MSSYPTDDPVQTTPLFDETVHAVDLQPLPPVTTGTGTGHSDASDTAKDTADKAKEAAGTAKDTVQDAAGQAKEQAQAVGSTAAEAGQRVASTTKDQASRVASDAVSQARDLYGQATEQLSAQAGKQQQNAASTLRTFGEDLSSMGQQQDGGLAAELVHALSTRASSTAEWLEQREPGDVLNEVKQFAARRPGLFIGLAAVAGIVAARATKALVADAKSPTPSAGVHHDAPTSTASTEVHGDAYGSGFGDIR